MEERNTQQKIQFIACPDCAGNGRGKLGLPCFTCAGMGVGTFLKGRFFYWGPKLSLMVIKLNNLKKLINKVINFTAYLISFIGLVALVLWFWLASENLKTFSEFAFWNKRSSLILIFWIGILAIMFIIYRLSEKDRREHKLEKLKYNLRKKKVRLPNNWDELRKVRNKIDVSEGLDNEAMKTLEKSFILAKKLKHEKVEALHLFFSLLDDNKAQNLFSRLNVDGVKLISKIENQLNNLLKVSQKEHKKVFNSTMLSNNIKEILIEAYINALNSNQEKVEPINFILPTLTRDSNLVDILYDLEIDEDKITNTLEWFRFNDEMLKNYKVYKKMARFKPGSNMDRAYTAVGTPVLDHFSYDLTRAAKWGKLDFCVTRDKEIDSIFQALESGTYGVILVGPLGVGKSVVVDGIARRMVGEDVPKMLKDKRLVEIDASRLISGASAEKAQERLLVMIDEAARAGNIILYIDNIENIIGVTAGEEQSLDLSEILVSALERKEICCLASATMMNYNKYIEGKPLGTAMYRVDIKEPEKNQAIQIVESKVNLIEAEHKVYFSYHAIDQVVEMSAKYIHDQCLPAKAINILKKVALEVSRSRGENSLVTKDDIAAVVSEITGIPTTKITEVESKSLLNLEDKIHERMIDQEEAVNMVSASLRRARTELRDVKRPIANFLFLGPTGVGKTELAKAVSEVYFGNEDYMIRLDMSEYQHPDSVIKMIGDSSGVRGYLTEAVRKAPSSLILLDEFEKAHPDILNLFLQVMDDGRLTDGQGKTIDFTNSIIIATSNVGAVYIQEQIIAGAKIEEIKESLINKHLNTVMHPELINRFDGVIVFKPLSQKDVEDIARLMIKKIKKMLLEKGMDLRVSEEGMRKLAQEGFDPKFGARPLKRLLGERINNIVANKILAGELKRRDTVVVDENANIQIEKRREF